MVSGLNTALGEVTLVLFTTLAPSGAVALMVMMGVLLFAKLAEPARARIDMWVCLPLVVTMVGLVASATHLGNPANALYVFLHVGSSPLSNEVLCAVLFLACAGLYWLYSFAERPNRSLQRVLQVALLLTGASFVTAVAFAYSVETIPTWNLPTSPVLLWLNALMGGPMLALLALYIAGWVPVAGAFGRKLGAASLVALLANVAGYAMQGALMGSVQNAVVAATELVPHYGALCAAAFVLAAAGCRLAGCTQRGMVRSESAAAGCALLFSKRICLQLIVANVLVFAAIFIMRFAFYMMHLTVGVAV